MDGQALNSTVEEVNLWYSVGVVNRGGSHGVAQIRALPLQKKFEMVAAGVGIGYCGAHVLAHETNIYVKASSDTGSSCSVTDEICVQASDISITASCTSQEKAFSLMPIGRLAVGNLPASNYPINPQVNLTMSGADDAFFGPESPVV